MHATTPASLDSAALSRRLSELAGHEREVQVEFLLHLTEYDLRRAWLEAGFGSLWDFLTGALHYREGAAHRRIRAMRVLRRLPHLADAFRDGRLCLTTAALLEPVLTEENAADLVTRAAFKSKADVEQLVVSPAAGRRRAGAEGEAERFAGAARDRDRIQAPRPHSCPRPAGSLEEGWRLLRLGRSGRSPLLQQVEARDRPHPPGSARRAFDTRQPAPALRAP